MLRIDAERLKRVIDYATDNGDAAACQDMGLTAESLGRYRREYAKLDAAAPTKRLLQKIRETYTAEELKAIAAGGRVTPGQPRVPLVTFDGECLTFAHITDTHMGGIYYRPAYLKQALQECEKEGVQFILHSGDLVEGMSIRPGHIYELTHLGYQRQRDYAIEQCKQWPGPWYMIDGNHDRWFEKGAGAYVVQDVCKALPAATYLGSDMGTLAVNGVTFQMFHGEDGNSYATSYRLQKLVEAFTGGEKPNMLLVGHTHKQGYFFERHVHVLSGGALSVQSRWMRSKRLANHTGFWIVRAWIGKKSINKLQTTWYPFYA
jgi:predicted phosphodiesterase